MALIGITCRYEESRGFVRLGFDYIRAVEKAGGTAFPLALLQKSSLAGVLEMLDGLVLSGGGDMDPSFYGEEPLRGHREISPLRDEVEIELTRLALQRGLPLLGICRGGQVLNVAAGGKIYQNLGDVEGAYLEHMQKAPRTHPFHDVELRPQTLLWEILGRAERIRVNSFHRQALKSLASGFRLSAAASDGVVEAFESPNAPFVLGVQWHPEALAAVGRPGGQELFDALLRAAEERKKKADGR